MEIAKGVKLKLCSHQKPHYKEAELLVNVRDLGPNFKEGDILEIYHPEEDERQSRLLMQVPHYEEEISVTKDTISVCQTIASNFNLRPYKDVIVFKVDPKSVALELVELTFKDQYLGRSDMWRFKMSLVNTVTYLKKTVEFCNNSIRCQTYEMWANGEKVTCGVVTEDTKVVFRSSTCQAYLFIQMSSEMWEFDMYGDLYFEKAVNGFLAELFTTWKNEKTNHDVTIVLFSRTYYKASSIEEFPPTMRDCLLQDYQGRFYEDFYRVAVQSDRYEDWMPILNHLRQLFHSYLDDVLQYHTSSEYTLPEPYNSNATQGNFLEVLNISLNVFEKHYIDRSFERTGQMSVVVTPGVGVFEVDRELTNITKQRIIDNGVGSDLVCLGEQPLHAVPLLKFNKKRGSLEADDYSMPHTWINLSFYSSRKRVPGITNFVPRIKVPQEVLRVVDNHKGVPFYPSLLPGGFKTPTEELGSCFPNSSYDYDAYDAQVFKVPSSQQNRIYRSLQRTPARKKTTSQSSSQPPPRVTYQRKLSDPDLYRTAEAMTSSICGKGEGTIHLVPHSPAITIPSKMADGKACSHSFGALNIEGIVERKMTAHAELDDMSPSFVTKVGSSGANSPSEFQQVTLGKLTPRPGRSLINPFNPSHVTIKRTSNRRRWIHTFPKGPTGVLIQQHHYQIASTDLSDDEESLNPLLDDDIEDFKLKSKSADHRSHDSLNMDESLTNGHNQNLRYRFPPSGEPWPNIGTSASSSITSTRGTSSPQKPVLYPQGVQPPPLPGIIPPSQGVVQPPCGNPTPTYVGHSTPLQINKHATLLWGATGEQEWSARITTGVDWKSLTLPACLPLTTDYFPDKQSLQYDYEVAANYSNVPDAVRNVFQELVSQRLSQGFQLIMRPDEARSNQRQNSLMRSRPSCMDEVIQEYKLSIGRVFHWLQYKDAAIDVTIYRPKHLYPPLERSYKFRFRSPYLTLYDVSWCQFETERLENYKWNNLDNYISFKGDQTEEFKLLEEFKFWRFRLMLVPDVFREEMHKLIEAPLNAPCDIYQATSPVEDQATVDNFIRFLEVIHRIKRSATYKKSWQGVRERVGSTRASDRQRPRPKTEKVRFESGGKEELEEEPRDEGEWRKLCQNKMSLTDMVEAMKDPISGIPFITASHTFLPSYTFISHDATVWVHKHIEDVSSQVAAVKFLQKVMDEELIIHASGDLTKKTFINGFYLYCLKTEARNPVDPLAFETEWHEISINPLPSKMAPSGTEFSGPSFDSELGSTPDNVPHKEGSTYRLGYLEIDSGTKSDRFEWGHLKYQTTYDPGQCFELIVQWMCATGTLVNDLIILWQRKATNLHLHLFPVPTEPYHSNPLRSAIMIPLNMDGVVKDASPHGVFSELAPRSLDEKIRLFQESILSKFGFFRYTQEGEKDGEVHHQYIHVTGNMIVLIGSSGALHSHSKLLLHRLRTTSFSPKEGFPHDSPCFLWTFNFMLTKRWKSNASSDEALGERILRDFQHFCANGGNRLKDFWASFCTSLLPDLSLSNQPFVDVCMQ